MKNVKKGECNFPTVGLGDHSALVPIKGVPFIKLILEGDPPLSIKLILEGPPLSIKLILEGIPRIKEKCASQI